MKTKLLTYLIIFSAVVNAQYKVLYNFNDETPNWGSLTHLAGKLYGMTNNGGVQDSGSIFCLDTNGSDFRTLFSFNGANGKNPCGSLIQVGNRFYSMTQYGGAGGGGCIFSVDTNGNGFKDLLGYDGFNPWGYLILLEDKLYGISNSVVFNYASVFSIDTGGVSYINLVTLINRYSPPPEKPLGSLTFSGDKLYGMFVGFGDYYGDVFSIDTNSGWTDLFDFDGTNGKWPSGSLTLSGGILYGMTQYGGANDSGCIFSIDTNGGRYKDMFDFNNTNGQYPIGSLLLAGNRLYGITYMGGANDNGCIFSIDTNGNGYEDMFDFNKASGCFPSGSLIRIDNTLYGMTRFGGTNDSGVIFSFKDTTIINSINEIAASKGAINVYPNPNNGSFTLSLSNTNEKCNVEIYNVLGEKVYFATLNPPAGGKDNNLINLTGQPSGVYFYRVISESGILIGEGKVIIEK